MNNSKLQQVFSRIILNSLPDNKEGLYKEANFLRSLWDFGRALKGAFGTLRQLRRFKSGLSGGSGTSISQSDIKALEQNLGNLAQFLPDKEKNIIQAYQKILSNPNFNTSPTLQAKIRALPEKYVSPWRLMAANPFKTTGLVLGVPTVGIGGYYGTRHALRNLLGTDPTTVRETIQQGISEGLRTGLQNVGLADEQGKISFTNLTNSLRSDLKGLISDLGTDLGGVMKAFGADLGGVTQTLGTDLRGLTQTLGTDLRGLTNEVGQNLKQSLIPQLVKQTGTSLGQGIIGSITDPMFQAVGIDPNSISPPLKLLILLGLAGGTFGLASRLARAF